MAAVRGIDDLSPTAALAVALATLEDIQRRDGLEDEMEEKAPACEAHTRPLEEEARHQHVRVVGRSCWKMKALRPLTPRALRRSSFEPTSGCVNLLKVTPLHQTPPEKTQNCIFDPTDDKKGSDSQSSRRNNRSESGFFNPRFRLHKKRPKTSTPGTRHRPYISTLFPGK